MSVRAFESITVSTTAIGCTAATYVNSHSALVTVEGGAVRFRADGTDPDASTGHELEVGDSLKLESADEVQRTKFIRRDGTDATLRVTYFV